jgi:hypothetical protein
MRNTLIATLALTICAIATVPEAASAQAIPFSQRGSVTQRVGITDITIDYSRPTARGRSLFPDLVNWGRIWTPGADSATRVTFSRDVTVLGHKLPAGSYSIWLIPTDNKAWPVIFNRDSHTYHQPYPGTESEAFRSAVAPTEGDDLDTLTLYFPWVRSDHATLRIHWGTTIIDIPIEAPLPDA